MKSPLPIVDGVTPSNHWLPPGRWKTILEFLKERFPVVATDTWTSRMAKGEVVDENGLRLNPASAYRVGARIFYYRELESEQAIPFEEEILYQDGHLLVLDKPHFLPVIPAGRFLHETLLVRLKKKLLLEDLVPVHRLDRETAGLVLFSVNPATRGEYGSLFRNRKVDKVYEALAPARPDIKLPVTRRSRIVPGDPFFRMKEVQGEPNSETHIEAGSPAEGVIGEPMLYRLRPATGRKHQLRVHMSALGIPIVNDSLYPEMGPPGWTESEESFSFPLKLLAKSIAFADPVTRREHYFQSSRTLWVNQSG
ncbi:MAG TPA: pseudouridine synthase [Pyrinomonadaceae bacterium]|nr:pseudouridine synthase [Pyrinomonadaceae bacterium]